MEDLTSTSSVYSKDELGAMCRHIVINQVSKITSLKESIESRCHDTSQSRDSIFKHVKECMFQMTSLWKDLGPARVIARRLYNNVDHAVLFDVLDKSLSVENAYEDLCVGKALILDKACAKSCCVTGL